MTKPHALGAGFSLDHFDISHDPFARVVPHVSSTTRANSSPDTGHFSCDGLPAPVVPSPSLVTALSLSPLKISDPGLHQNDGHDFRHFDAIDKDLLPSNGDQVWSRYEFDCCTAHDMSLQAPSSAERYVDELLRLEGRGGWNASCGGCPVVLHGGVGLRCDDCHDLGLYCVACCLRAHRQHPLHRIKVSYLGELNSYSPLMTT